MARENTSHKRIIATNNKDEKAMAKEINAQEQTMQTTIKTVRTRANRDAQAVETVIEIHWDTFTHEQVRDFAAKAIIIDIQTKWRNQGQEFINTLKNTTQKITGDMFIVAEDTNKQSPILRSTLAGLRAMVEKGILTEEQYKAQSEFFINQYAAKTKESAASKKKELMGQKLEDDDIDAVLTFLKERKASK